jgi:hypothetical protein
MGQKYVGDASDAKLSVLYPHKRNGRLAVNGTTIHAAAVAHRAVLEFDELRSPVVISEDPRGNVTDRRLLASPKQFRQLSHTVLKSRKTAGLD